MNNSDTSNNATTTLNQECQNLANSAYDIRAIISATTPTTDDVKTKITNLTIELNNVLDSVGSQSDIDPNQIYQISDRLSGVSAHMSMVSSQLSVVGFSVEDRLEIYTELSEGIIKLEKINNDFIAKNDPTGSIKQINQLDDSTSPDIKEFLITQTSMIQKLMEENSKLTKELTSVKRTAKQNNEVNQDLISDLSEEINKNPQPSAANYFEKRREARELVKLQKDVAEQKDLESDRRANRGFFDTMLNGS